MPAIDQPQLADLVWKTRQCPNLWQTKFAVKLWVSFQRINRWENGRTKPLLIELKQIESLLHQMGEASQDLLVKCFSE